MRTSPVALVMAVLCLVGGRAVAEGAPILGGQVVETTYLFPTDSTVLCGPVNSTVGAGVELFSYCGLADIDFSDTNITITLTRNAGVNNVAFDGWRFFDVFGTIPTNLLITLNPATNYAGFDDSRLSADTDTLWVNVANLPGLTGQLISIDLAARDQGTPAPEPGVLAMLMAGAAGLLRRRRSSLGK